MPSLPFPADAEWHAPDLYPDMDTLFDISLNSLYWPWSAGCVDRGLRESLSKIDDC